jgi:hypothetical protein
MNDLTASNESRLDNTLGLFVQGIPAIFLRTDVFAHTPALTRYIDFYTQSRVSPSLNANFCSTDYVTGYKHSITLAHEIRHFHDSVLCRRLFELFIVRTKLTIILLQLASHLNPLQPTELPLSPSQLRKKLPSNLLPLVTHLEAADSQYKSRFADIHKTENISGHPISIAHMVEGSAIVLEMANVVYVHGWDAANYYYERAVLSLPSLYTRFFDLVRIKTSSWREALELTHIVLCASLYDDDDPLLVAADLINGSATAESLRGASQNKVGRLFEKETELERRIDSMSIMAAGAKIDPSLFAGTSFLGLVELPRQMLRARSLLISRCVRTWKFSLGPYLERLNETPIPASIFYPVGTAEVDAIKLSDISTAGGSPYIIAATPSEPGKERLVASAIVATLGVPPWTPFDVVDLVMLVGYVYRRLFVGNEPVYAGIIDYMYDRLFKKWYSISEG